MRYEQDQWTTYTLLEEEEIILSQGISLGNDRNQVDAGAQSLHDFDIERLQSVVDIRL